MFQKLKFFVANNHHQRVNKTIKQHYALTFLGNLSFCYKTQNDILKYEIHQFENIVCTSQIQKQYSIHVSIQNSSMADDEIGL